MSIFDHLDKLLKNPPLKLTIDNSCVIFSDRHAGDGSLADNFFHNRNRFERVLAGYLNSGWTIFINGDVNEEWQFKITEIKRTYTYMDERIILIPGNHDETLVEPEAILLIHLGKRYLIIHGHQTVSNARWKIAHWFARYPWKWLELMGFKEPLPLIDRHPVERGNLIEWANRQDIEAIIYGHTHLLEIIGKATFCGCLVTDKIQCVELVDRLKLKIWE